MKDAQIRRETRRHQRQNRLAEPAQPCDNPLRRTGSDNSAVHAENYDGLPAALPMRGASGWSTETPDCATRVIRRYPAQLRRACLEEWSLFVSRPLRPFRMGRTVMAGASSAPCRSGATVTRIAYPSRSGSPSGAENRRRSEQPGQSQSHCTHPSPRSAAVTAASVQPHAPCTAEAGARCVPPLCRAGAEPETPGDECLKRRAAPRSLRVFAPRPCCCGLLSAARDRRSVPVPRGRGHPRLRSNRIGQCAAGAVQRFGCGISRAQHRECGPD
jgi:hypothetical protein